MEEFVKAGNTVKPKNSSGLEAARKQKQFFKSLMDTVNKLEKRIEELERLQNGQ